MIICVYIYIYIHTSNDTSNYIIYDMYAVGILGILCVCMYLCMYVM